MLPSAEIISLRDKGALQCGPGMLAHRARGAELDYFAFVPHGVGADAPLVVTVHGIERLALQHAVRFSAVAEQHGFIVLAPVFSKQRTPRYQKLERGPRGDCPLAAMDLTVDHLQRAIGLNPSPVRLFGYSGGAQFAMRYALLGSLPIARLALAAPGWFTMPDLDQPYPEGLGDTPMLEGRAPDLSRLLAMPVLLTVGEEDTRRDRSLNRKKAIDAAQGLTRLERAHRWTAAMTAAANARGLPVRTELRVLPGAGHDFDDNMKSHGLGEIVANWLLG